MAKNDFVEKHSDAIAAAIIVLLLVVFVAGVFNQVCCKWAKIWGGNECPADGGGSGGGGSGWDGQCTPAIEDECCDYMNVRMCNNQFVTNPEDCRQYYCEETGDGCYPVMNTAMTGYNCQCKDVLDEGEFL